MTTLPTAKILLFIALHVGPHQPSEVFATSLSDSYSYTTTQKGWTVEGLSFPASNGDYNPGFTSTGEATPSSSAVPKHLRAVAQHNWGKDSAMVFLNGDRVERHGDHAFYIQNAGGANEKVYTICFKEAPKKK